MAVRSVDVGDADALGAVEGHLSPVRGPGWPGVGKGGPRHMLWVETGCVGDNDARLTIPDDVSDLLAVGGPCRHPLVAGRVGQSPLPPRLRVPAESSIRSLRPSS